MNPSLKDREWIWVIWVMDLALDEALRRDWRVNWLGNGGRKWVAKKAKAGVGKEEDA